MSRRALAAAAAALALFGAPQLLSASVRADNVGDAQQNLQRAQAELDDLVNRMGRLDEQYGQAQDTKAQLDDDVAVSQRKVDDMTARLGQLQAVMSDLAVTKFTTGGNTALSPLFSSAAAYSAAEQKDALDKVAFDTGAASADDLQQLVDDLSKEKASLERKQQKVAELIATLQQTQQQFDALQSVYTTKLSEAEARFGAAQLEAEAERQAAAAAQQAAQQQQQQQDSGGGAPPSTTAPGRGGGGSDPSTPTTTPTPTPPKPTPPPPPPVSGKAGVAVAAAYSQIGTPYHFAGETPGVAFDCSGLTKWAWGRAGVYLPHSSAGQYASIPHISRDQIQPGDLIFYYAPIGHVGIYVGGGMMIHAPNTGTTVALVPVRWGKVVGVGRPG